MKFSTIGIFNDWDFQRLGFSTIGIFNDWDLFIEWDFHLLIIFIDRNFQRLRLDLFNYALSRIICDDE